MSETIQNQENIESVEVLQQELNKALIELGDAAAAVGKFETGRPEADFGMSDNLAESKQKASAIFEKLLAAIIAKGEAVGVASQTEELDFRI